MENRPEQYIIVDALLFVDDEEENFDDDGLNNIFMMMLIVDFGQCDDVLKTEGLFSLSYQDQWDKLRLSSNIKYDTSK